MNNEDFVEFCYNQILRRNSDNKGKTHYLNQLNLNLITRENVLMHFVTSKEFVSIISSHEFVPSGHFYSAIPSAHEKDLFLSSEISKNINILGINLNTQKQTNLLQIFKKYYHQCSFPESKTEQSRYYFSNPAYSYSDALTLYSMIRAFKPKKVIEIGSGYSSCAMLDTNDQFFNGEINFTFIEPYPDLLYSLINHNDISKQNIIPKKIQEVDEYAFSELRENDILFIDSTHVSKLNSDVNLILFKILPSLQKGVLIHFHDIFWPFEYPKEWLREGRAWNEIYLLRAFLEFNESFEILFYPTYLFSFLQPWFQENMPLYLKNTGGNIWLRKIK